MLLLFEDNTKYEIFCKEFSSIFAEFTEPPPERKVEHHTELLDSNKPPIKLM